MEQQPEQFRDVRCLVALQPLSTRVAVERMLELAGVPVEAIEDLEQQMRLIRVSPWTITLRSTLRKVPFQPLWARSTMIL